LFALAGHLRMTVRELCSRMDSQELTEWLAFTRYYKALPDEWQQAGLIVSSLLAPYSKDRVPSPADFMPLEKPPNHPQQDLDALMELRRQLGHG